MTTLRSRGRTVHIQELGVGFLVEVEGHLLGQFTKVRPPSATHLEVELRGETNVRGKTQLKAPKSPLEGLFSVSSPVFLSLCVM